MPVGGAIVACPSLDFIQGVSAAYAGRASISPIMDLFITLVSMGETNFRALLETRKENFSILRSGLCLIAEKYDMTLAFSPNNAISVALVLSSTKNTPPEEDFSYLGSMLFQRNISGCRVVVPVADQVKICGFQFSNWGAHSSQYQIPYLTAACAIGVDVKDIEIFLAKLDKIIQKFRRQKKDDC